MKKILILIYLLPVLISANVFEFNTFSSEFSETILDSDSTQVAEIKGNIYIKKPSFLRMDVNFPEKQVMIVRGDSAMILIKKSKQITYSELSNENAWLMPSNILFNKKNMFKTKKKNDTLILTPNDSLIPLDSIIVNGNLPLRFIDIYTKEQVLKFSFSKQKTDGKLDHKLFVFPKKKNKN